jgi:uncharacterized protein
MSSVGINRVTGKPLTNWSHVMQSILDIMTTPIGTRVMRRDYGSDIPNLIDRPQGRDTVLEVTLALGTALEKWEPRFRLSSVYISDAGPDGEMTIAIKGDYYPRGHLGDFDEVITDRELTLHI